MHKGLAFVFNISLYQLSIVVRIRIYSCFYGCACVRIVEKSGSDKHNHKTYSNNANKTKCKFEKCDVKEFHIDVNKACLTRDLFYKGLAFV